MSERVEDLAAWRYRTLHILRNNVEAMAVELECRRDADLGESLFMADAALASLKIVDRRLKEAQDEAEEA